MIDHSTNTLNQRILIIDDNPSIHQDFLKILSPDQSNDLDQIEASLFEETSNKPVNKVFKIDSAFQGQEGVERVEQAVKNAEPYAMAFVDVRMPPGIDGIGTTMRIWEIDPDIQIVICTAFSDYSWDEMIAKVGQSDRLVILKKPFDNIEVLQLANALTEKWKLLQQARIKVSDLEQMVNAQTVDLRKSEELFRLITENTADLITIVDKNGLHLYTSPSYKKLLGYLSDELSGRSLFDQLHIEDQPTVKSLLTICSATGKDQILEYRMQHKDGDWHVFESHCATVQNTNGQVENLVIVARDITTRKRIENERKQMEVLLRHAQKLESIGQLAAGIAHEINTPMQYINDNTCFLQESFCKLNQLLEDYKTLFTAAKENTLTSKITSQVETTINTVNVDYLTKEIPTAIEQTLEGIKHVTKIIRSMKDFSHPGAEEKVLVDLNKAIESTITVARNEWKYVAEMQTHLDPQLPPVPCLANEINQVILNLIINAAHAIEDVVGKNSGKKGTIIITTQHSAEYVEILIQDTGKGIPETIRDRIFDPFFTTKPVGKGTGQGLAITHSVIVDKHNGTVNFKTQEGQGTTFIIRLPISAK